MICCVTGHRPKGFPFPRDKENELYDLYLRKLKEEIKMLIGEGYDHFISGMAEGADLDFAVCVAELRQSGYKIILEAALPYPVPSRKSEIPVCENSRENLLHKYDIIVEVSPHYFRGCMHKRNRYMVDHTSLLIAAFDGTPGGTSRTVEYALRRGLAVVDIPIPVEKAAE
jgi:uncharacterized phage-like protein YoqJ